MSYDQDETHAMLFRMSLECARPSWRFRLLFGARERKLMEYSINTFMGERQKNLLMHELDRRYLNHGNAGQATQAGAEQMVVSGRLAKG